MSNTPCPGKRPAELGEKGVPLDRHCQQGLQKGFGIAEDLPFSRILDHDLAEEKEYREREGESKTVCHWGQRKLMLAEIEFLTKFYSRAKCVVYAGAAPGTHILFLAQMFPKLRFVLVDPRPFSSHLVKAGKDLLSPDTNLPRIELQTSFFTDELAKRYATEEGVLFISDVRTSDDSPVTPSATVPGAVLPNKNSTDLQHPSQNYVENDMQLQQKWHFLMQPVASSFKFRLPWGGGTTEYLKGDIFLPVWGPVTTTESRLFVDRDAVRDAAPSAKTHDDSPQTTLYDNGKYERQMFDFNTHRRIAKYKNSNIDFYQCSCFDCTSECAILESYYTTVVPTPPEVPRELPSLSQRLDRECHRDYQNPRTLFHGNPDPAERKNRILKRQKRR